MNLLIENLNGWGENFLRFAWPMLWQSSLLIAIVSALDFLSARKIPAAIRYALWLAVLVKLLLPPTLALPTGAAWWLFQSKPEIKTPPIAKKFVVTYDNAVSETEFVPVPSVVAEIPKPKFNGAAWLLLASGAIGLALFSLLIYRCRQVVRKICTAQDAENFSEDLEAAKQLANFNPRVRLKIVDVEMSPAVCGLFRPVILLPRALAVGLSAGQLRAVLLHEIFHLRRRDIWVNSAQALLQIFYWWHPLLWVANARIRRVREEAVDDAVMLALREEAETYAPTLLEVAKLALRRPLTGLGLVGIMESRNALRQRVERLVNFRAPRRAGLTVFSALGIFAFSAVALPMGEAPEKVQQGAAIKVENDGVVLKNGNSTSAALVDNAYTPANTIPTTQPAVLQNSNPPMVLIQAEIYQMREKDFKALVSDQMFRQTRQDAVYNFQPLDSLLKSSGPPPIQRPRIQTSSGTPAALFVGDATNSIEFECCPFVTNGLIDLASKVTLISTTELGKRTRQMTNQAALANGSGLILSMNTLGDSGATNLIVVAVHAEIVKDEQRLQQRLQAVIKRAGGPQTNTAATNSGRRAIISKLEKIRLENFSSAGLPLNQILGELAVQSKSRDPERVGINFLFNPVEEQSGTNPATGLTSSGDAHGAPAKISVTVAVMTNATLGDVLDAVRKGASEPVHYVIRDYGVEFKTGTNPPVFFTRTFKLDENVFVSSLERAGFYSAGNTNSSPAISAAARKFFASLGVDLDSPAGKAVFFNDRNGMLLVRAEEKDLSLIDQAIQVLAQTPPQVHIKTRFLEVPKGAAMDFTGLMSVSNAAVGSFSGILDSAKSKQVYQKLSAVTNSEIWGEPEVTTLSGRQTQIRATQVVTVVTNFAFQESIVSNAMSMKPEISGAVFPQMAPFEFGPVVDLVPNVLSDGYTINLAVTTTLNEFRGYDNGPKVKNVVENSDRVQLPVILPHFNRRQITATMNLLDNQTAMLAGMSLQKVSSVKYNPAGGVPLFGKLFRSQQLVTNETEIVVFITATIVDPAGNRVHTDAELTSARKRISPQPAK